MTACSKCNDYKKCTRNRDYFTYGEIRFCPFQVIFLLEHLDTLLIGKWPPSPDGSTYIDPAIRRTVPLPYASFEKPCDVAAELEYRLRRTGTDGKLLIAEIRAGMTFELSKEAQNALSYIKGWRRKRVGYRLWLAQRNYYKKYSKGQNRKSQPKY